MQQGFKRALGALLIVTFLYSLLGFLILPGVALRIANQQLAQYASEPASLARLQFDPFNLELRLWDLRVGAGERPPLTLARLTLDLQLDSLWRGALHLSRLELERPSLDIQFAKDGQLNLARLFKLPAPAATPDDQERRGLFPLRIDQISLTGGSLGFRDRRPRQAIELDYQDLALQLRNFSTEPDSKAEMALSASAPRGGRIDWQGQLSLSPLSSSGRLAVEGIELLSVWPYVQEALPLALKEGRASLSTDYRLAFNGELQLRLDNGQASLAPFALQTPDGRPLVELASLQIAGAQLDLGKRHVRIASLRSQQLQAWAAREADGRLDWLQLLGQPAAQAPEEGEAAPTTTAPRPSGAPARPWQVLLDEVQLRDYRLQLADRLPQTAVELQIGPLDLDLQDFDSQGARPFSLALDSGIGPQGRLKATGQAQLAPVRAALSIDSQAIDLRPLQAYLTPLMHLELRSGQLASQLHLTLEAVTPLAFGVSGKAQIQRLHTLDTIKERDFVRWQQLALDGIDYQHGERLNIDKVSLQEPYGRFIVNEDLSTNIDDLLVERPAVAAAPQPTGAAPLALRIGEIQIRQGSANFADFSLNPNFATAIQQLDGRIGTLDSRSPQPASVNISGKVDRYAPVTIEGSLNPFDPLASLNLSTRFRQVELTTLTPYSGKFAGFRIRKGRLNLDLNYRINNGQLRAQNKLLIEQLQLGEKVDSPSAVDLPVRLAVALLKDAEGKIDIELPIQGDLNNPEFSVMPIIWKTLRSLIVRAAQAPFKFIAGLAGGAGDLDLSHVEFAAGSAELDEMAQRKLDSLAAALQQRPALQLEVEGASTPVLDGPPLAEQRLQLAYRETYYKMLQRRGASVPAEPSQLAVPEEDKPALLEGIYRARLRQQPPAEWAELEAEPRAAKLRDGLLQSWAQSKLLQRQLARARAATIKAYLVERGALADARIFLLDVNLEQSPANGQVPNPLQLDSR